MDASGSPNSATVKHGVSNGIHPSANASSVSNASGPKASSITKLNRFSFLNIHGLKPATVPSKVPYLSDMLNHENHLFIGLTETWLKDHKDAELKIEGYQLFRSDRKRSKTGKRGRLSGGAAAYIRDDIASRTEYSQME